MKLLHHSYSTNGVRPPAPPSWSGEELDKHDHRGPCRNSGTRRHMLAWAERALRRSFWETKDHQLTERKCLN